ncbi:PA14 domain-containing protein [Bacillus cereus]|uniref:binary toxin-like calcium binding domain-containing protein n=1 Tax=Bacillus cereus TaxID=1396 RepID=UPI0020422CB2|nr:binary toxin-like calcium binding domain-containing protein [Bacillus cereus]MCM3222915.1 PA14 domain-containing protein [Bacillus cereus]MEC3336038.1 PA14 domain-containing protein [Bacillus cereus]
MKKILTCVLSGTILILVLLSENISPIYAKEKREVEKIQQIDKEDKINFWGLLGYYYKDQDFNNLITIAPTYANTLSYEQEIVDKLLDKNSQIYQSIRWVGLIKSKESGTFTFKFSEDKNTIIELNGEIVSKNGQEKKTVYLEKEKLIPIKIEYKPNVPLNKGDLNFQNLNMYKTDECNKVVPVQQKDLRNPDFQNKETAELLEYSSKTSLFSNKITQNESIDTDGDGIPDNWEENGYTIQNKIAVKWTGELASKGYIKFVSNPLDAHTAGDPYTDYEKAARNIDKSNKKETFNPLVAAFPSVNVSLEKINLATEEGLSNSIGSQSSNNWSYTTMENASIESAIGKGIFSLGISKNYQYSNIVGVEWGHSTEDTSHVNSAESSYLNANVRYNNVGTGAIYNANPITNFNLADNSIGAINVIEKSSALNISPGESYPKKGKTGIPVNSMGDFDFRPIILNKEQTENFLENTPIMLETNQVEGQYMVRNKEGKLVLGGEWQDVTPRIQEKTAAIIVDDGETVSEKRIAAKDYNNLDDKTPSLTLKDALKLGFPDDIIEKEKLLYYKNKPIYESSIMAYVDKKTAEEIEKQVKDKTENFKDTNYLYDIRLTPEMKFTIKLSSLYDGAEPYETMGIWHYANNVVGGNTGKREYRSNHPAAYVLLSSKSKNKLLKNTNYYISMYMRADSDIEPTIEIKGEKDTITSQKIKLNTEDYTRVDIPIKNTEKNPINQIIVKGNGKTYVYWDDVSISKVSAMKP